MSPNRLPVFTLVITLADKILFIEIFIFSWGAGENGKTEMDSRVDELLKDSESGKPKIC